MARGHGSRNLPPPRPNARSSRVPKTPSAPKAGVEDSEQSVSAEVQHRCLNIFRDALKPDEKDNATLQGIKGHLYNRDFSAAFGREEYLRVYASRWSPSRALGYLQVFADVQDFVLPESTQRTNVPFETVCLGGGAGAEHVALAGWWSQLGDSHAGAKLSMRLVDIASWETTMHDLQKAIVTPPELSKYASASAKEANKPLLTEDALHVLFQQQDILNWPEPNIAALVRNAKLVTLMFTLNELYSTSIPQTQRLLSHLTTFMQPNTFLLVVDSPGSYSTVSINGAEKKYPMQWLLDYTLLNPPQTAGKKQVEAKWEKVVSETSRWFRMPEGLGYPIELQDMRYQMHLYRKLGEDDAD